MGKEERTGCGINKRCCEAAAALLSIKEVKINYSLVIFFVAVQPGFNSGVWCCFFYFVLFVCFNSFQPYSSTPLF